MRLATRVRWWCCALALLGLAGVGRQATAQQPAASMTLRKIMESGVISIGYRDASMPFSYLNGRQQPVGYSMDICQRIVDAVKLRLQPRELTVKLVPVTTATRIPLVANGIVDLECGVTTNNLERQKQVAFSLTTFVSESRMVSKRAASIQGVNDLRGRSVVSTVGTTSIKYLSELVAHRGVDATILAVKDDTEAFRMVETDRAAAYAMDDVLLRSAVANARHAEDYVISSEALSVEPYGIMFAKGDTEFKELANGVIRGLFKSGEIQAIYRKWFMSPIPPNGIDLQMPMRPALEKVIAHPTDSGNPAAYAP